MRKLMLILALLSGFAAPAMAEEGAKLDTAPNRIDDLASLQRGAKLFVNYCLNCHSAASMRYSRLKDLGLSEAEIKNNLLFTTDKIGETMTVAMRKADAKAWFGVAPPDLSVEARHAGRTGCIPTCGRFTVTTRVRRGGTTWRIRMWACPTRSGRCRVSGV